MTVLNAVAKDAAGNAISGATIAWASSDPAVIAVAGDGTVTAKRIGSVTISATSGSAVGEVTFTSSLTPYTFVFAPTQTEAEQQMIKDNVQYAHALHKKFFNKEIAQATTVTTSTNAAGCSAGGSAAFTGPGAVTFCISNPGWMQPGPILKQKIVQHELFHVWQFENHWLGNSATAGATWIIEGSAELMGYRGIADRDLIPMPTAIGCQVKESFDFKQSHPPGLPALSTVEAPQAFQTTVGPIYTESMLAIDQLTATPGILSLRTYADLIAGGTQWQTAFNASFGMSLAAFYNQFPAYRAGQAVPPNYLCGL